MLSADISSSDGQPDPGGRVSAACGMCVCHARLCLRPVLGRACPSLRLAHPLVLRSLWPPDTHMPNISPNVWRPRTSTAHTSTGMLAGALACNSPTHRAPTHSTHTQAPPPTHLNTQAHTPTPTPTPTQLTPTLTHTAQMRASCLPQRPEHGAPLHWPAGRHGRGATKAQSSVLFRGHKPSAVAAHANSARAPTQGKRGRRIGPKIQDSEQSRASNTERLRVGGSEAAPA